MGGCAIRRTALWYSIKSQPLEDDTEVPSGLEEFYERCLPYYEKLHEKRLRPLDNL